QAGLDRLGVGGTPPALGAELGEADADELVTPATGRAVVATVAVPSATAGQGQHGGRCQCRSRPQARASATEHVSSSRASTSMPVAPNVRVSVLALSLWALTFASVKGFGGGTRSRQTGEPPPRPDLS